MPKDTASTVSIIASAIALPVADGGVKRRMRIVPFGSFGGRDGRGPWHLRGKDHAEQVIAATKAFLNGVDLLVNYDHQTEYAAVPKVGGQAKAAGWINPNTLQVGEDGIYGEADWTEVAEAALQAREYRYYSPHFRASKSTGDLTKIVNLGLTNSPNIEVSALASQETGAPFEEGNSMSIAKLLSATALTALALTVESDDEAAINAIDQLVEGAGAAEGVLASVRTTLSVDEDADEDVVLAAIVTASKGGEPDPKKYVPVSALEEVTGQLATINEERVLNAVDAAIEGGKLPPSLKDWAIEMGKDDMSALNAYLDKAPTFQGGKIVEGKPDAPASKLTEEEAVVCSTMGWSEAEFLEQKKKEAA